MGHCCPWATAAHQSKMRAPCVSQVGPRPPQPISPTDRQGQGQPGYQWTKIHCSLFQRPPQKIEPALGGRLLSSMEREVSLSTSSSYRSLPQHTQWSYSLWRGAMSVCGGPASSLGILPQVIERTAMSKLRLKPGLRS